MTLLTPVLTLFTLGAKFGIELGYIDGSTLGPRTKLLTNPGYLLKNAALISGCDCCINLFGIGSIKLQ